MTLRQRQYETARRGVKGAKLWVSWPVVIDAGTLDQLHKVSILSGAPVTVLVDDEAFEVESWMEGGGLSTALQFDPVVARKARKSITLISRNLVIHLGPRTAYAYAKRLDGNAQQNLWKVQRILREAAWQPGVFFYRTWGGLVLVPLGVAAGSALADPSNVTVPIAGVLTAASAGVTSALPIRFRRIRMALTAEDKSGRRVVVDQAIGALAGVVGSVAVALILRALNL